MVSERGTEVDDFSEEETLKSINKMWDAKYIGLNRVVVLFLKTREIIAKVLRLFNVSELWKVQAGWGVIF